MSRKHRRNKNSFHFQPHEEVVEFKLTNRVKAVSKNQQAYIDSIRTNPFTLAIGHAGSGKTFCAIGMALKYLFMDESGIDKIIIIRMAMPAFDDDIGYLPGDAYEKMLPYFGSILDNIEHFIHNKILRRLLKEKRIEIVPLAFLRGRTFNDCFIIVEEAQNVSVEAMKMILTRVGENSKIVITGDVNQKDTTDSECGLLDATIRFEGEAGFGVCKLYDSTDIVRNAHTSRIIEKYNETLLRNKDIRP